jgi:hypothetical protein
MPVLPEVGSRTMVSGPILPAASAASSMATAMRSLTLWAGLKNSSLRATVAPLAGARRFSLTRGVADEFGDVVGDAHGGSPCRGNGY